MIQARQQVVAQEANIALIAIRQAEITYFSTFFSSFGTQCFLLAGILAGSVSQTPGFECATRCIYFWQIFYNVSVSICLGLTCLVLLAAVFISVFGQGLAIRGPPGSMINTVQGMIAEQQRIVTLFCWVVLSYMTQLVGMYFIVMDWEIATVCAGITGLSTYYTYFCAIRIYNRFKWDFKKSGWNFDDETNDEEALNDLSPEVIDEILKTAQQQQQAGSRNDNRYSLNKKKFQQIYKDSLRKGLLSVNDSNEKKKNVILSMMKKMKGSSSASNSIASSKKSSKKSGGSRPLSSKGGSVISDEQPDDDNDDTDSDFYPTDFRSNSNDLLPSFAVDERKSGYLTIKTTNPKRSSFTPSSFNREKWIRYYFVLRGHNLFYYEDRKSFERNASKPINARPIDLNGYNLIVESIEQQLPPFTFSLVPLSSEDIRKTWKFRCDTVNEVEAWTKLLKNALMTTEENNNSDNKDI
jgi:hypothetical protein